MPRSGSRSSPREVSIRRLLKHQPGRDDSAKGEALGLFVMMLRIFAASKHAGADFNKLVVFDEAHKYITESELIGQVVETLREMRYQATSVVIASQDRALPDVPGRRGMAAASGAEKRR